LDTFVHAITRRKIAAPNRTESAGFAVAVSCSRSGTTAASVIHVVSPCCALSAFDTVLSSRDALAVSTLLATRAITA
jgi:hypothetical protein